MKNATITIKRPPKNPFPSHCGQWWPRCSLHNSTFCSVIRQHWKREQCAFILFTSVVPVLLCYQSIRVSLDRNVTELPLKLSVNTSVAVRNWCIRKRIVKACASAYLKETNTCFKEIVMWFNIYNNYYFYKLPFVKKFTETNNIMIISKSKQRIIEFEA